MGLIKGILGLFKKKSPVIKRDIMHIIPGDIILYYKELYEVIAVIDWLEEGFASKEYRIKKADESFWISAEIDDGEIWVALYQQVEDLDIKIPPPKEIKYKEEIYTLDDKGKTVGVMKSKQGNQNLQCKYYDYEAGNKLLCIEDYNGEIEISIGQEIKHFEIDIMSGGKK